MRKTTAFPRGARERGAEISRPVKRAPVLQQGMALLALLLLAGCTLLPPPAETNTPTVAQESLISPLEYYAWAQQAGAAEILAEMTRLKGSQAVPDAFVNAVQRSILLGFSANATDQGVPEAATLLHQAMASAPASAIYRDYEVFAGILLASLQQRQALGLAGTENARQGDMIKQLEAGTRQLQEQIKALTSIERQIIEREQQQKPELNLEPLAVPSGQEQE